MGRPSHDSSTYGFCTNPSNMASDGQSGKWEVVGKGGKKRTPNEGKKNKVKASDMPKAEIISKSTNCS